MASKSVRFVAGPGLQAAIRHIRKAKDAGVSVPDLAITMETNQSTADNYCRRLYEAGLVEKYDGETPGHVGRPPVLWVWVKGMEVDLVSPEDVKAQAHEEAEARKAQARASRLRERAEELRAGIPKLEAEAEKAQAKFFKAKTHQVRTHLEAVVRRAKVKVKALRTRAASLELQAKNEGMAVAGRKARAALPKPPSKAKSKPAPKPRTLLAANLRKGQDEEAKRKAGKRAPLTPAQREAKAKRDKDRRAKGKPAADAPSSELGA